MCEVICVEASVLLELTCVLFVKSVVCVCVCFASVKH